MAWPRFCASSSSAKVESPRMLIRSIGSICTATFKRIDAPRTCFPTANSHPTASAASAVDLKFLSLRLEARLGTSNPKPPQSHKVASVPLIPKFASEGATRVCELRNRDTSVERRGDMPRNAARRHQHGIETDIADAIIGVSRQPRLGGGGDAQALAIGDRPRGVVQCFAGLDLDEHQQASAAGDDVDFADRALPTPRQDAKAFGDEKRRRPALG